MNTEATEKPAHQWHPAFYAGIRIELETEENKLIFENEHQLGTKPKEIDVLIIKKNSTEPIQKNIGRIFRTHNIVEYKSPTDYLSVDDFYKVYAYACLYKSDTATEGDIPAEAITISFVCKRYPRKMMKHLQTSRSLTVSPFEPGIYYITGDIFPMQLIVTSELSEDNNLWLRNLTNDLKSSDSARKLLRSYEQHRHNRNYKSVMNIIMRANNELFQEEKGTMCEALLELMHDEIEAIVEEKEELAMERGMERGMEKGMEKGMEEGLRETVKNFV